MDISDLVSPEAVIPSLKVTSKKHLLQELSRRAAGLTGLQEQLIFDILLEREKLGTTGVGRGVAIPHGKIADIKSLFGMFVRLSTPVDFEAIDDGPVDLVFLLLVPEGAGADHLKALARISRLLRDQSMCDKLRGSESADALYALLSEETADAA